jgi:hypothetical protein
VDPPIVAPGEPVTLRWSVSGGRVGISPGIGPVTGSTGVRRVFPSATTTYTLTASAAIRSSSRSAKVAVAGRTFAVSFTAEPLTIRLGGSAELVWSVGGGAARVMIDQGIGAVQGSGRLKVTPTAPTVYTLRAEAPGGTSREASVTVLVEAPVPKPAIVSLSADPQSIRSGETARLSWQVAGADTLVSFDHDIGRVKPNGAINVQPSATTQYKLSARNPGGSISKNITVAVVEPEPPKIPRFAAQPASISFAQSTTLSWSVQGEVNSIDISPAIGTVPAEGSRRVSPPATTTYTISANGPGGSARLDTTVRVAAAHAPTIVTFTANPAVIAPRQVVTLYWKVEGDVDSVTLDPGKVPVKVEGSGLMQPAESIRYTLTARGPAGSQIRWVDIRVSADRFQIAAFQIKPAKIKRGQSATISWRVMGPVTDISIDPAVGSLQGRSAGSVEVRPDRDTEYVLTARAGKEFLVARAKVSVRR